MNRSAFQLHTVMQNTTPFSGDDRLRMESILSRTRFISSISQHQNCVEGQATVDVWVRAIIFSQSQCDCLHINSTRCKVRVRSDNSEVEILVDYCLSPGVQDDFSNLVNAIIEEIERRSVAAPVARKTLFRDCREYIQNFLA